jgi:hypothetical protein
VNLEPDQVWYQGHPRFRSSGIRAGLTGIAGVEDKMGKASKNAWLRELEEINQTIQAENVELRRLLQESEEEKRKLRLQLQAMEEQVGECSTTEATKSPSCGHGRYTSYGSCHDDVDSCTYCQMIEDALQTPGNQGGFLEASSTTSSNQEDWPHFK